MPSTTKPPAPRKRKPPKSRATQPKFERLDIPTEKKVGALVTEADLGAISDRVERFHAAARTTNELTARMAVIREDRNQLAVGLTAYHGVRAVHEAAGMHRHAMRRTILHVLQVEHLPTEADRVLPAGETPAKDGRNVIDRDAVKALAEAAGVPEPRDVHEALNELADMGREYLHADGSLDVARAVRNELTIELFADGTLTWTDLKNSLGVNVTTLSHLLSRARKAGRDIPNHRGPQAATP